MRVEYKPWAEDYLKDHPNWLTWTVNMQGK